MENKRVHYILIPILLLLLGIYSYKKLNKNEEIQEKPAVETLEPKDAKTEIKTKLETSDSIVQIGDCYSYEQDGNYYGVIVIKYEDDDLFTVGILEEVKQQQLKIIDFEKGNLMCAKTELLVGNPVKGLWTGFFFKDDLKVFKSNFKYVGKIKLNETEIDVNGGGTLISSSEVNVEDLHNSKMLKGISRYREPMEKYIE
ncbi:hypothetical protein [Flavobacterium quisquiliarum]|uniref:LPS export ABC transporter periplasmic protein LptC n=1 Tax=Flavobacterium quisquiliarum TaxID=1834436 RepID=A0ABV8W8S3_9FLAO|nr:hypothetical protein [Flavobacterium quisquiliarum]MBW1654384.1 hypothetical protein [Flavobacterium quisquiliarum]NWL01184.1 hypothetical protein [Flavobacterium collinsii]